MYMYLQSLWGKGWGNPLLCLDSLVGSIFQWLGHCCLFLIEFEHEAAVRGVAYGIYIYTRKMIFYVGLSSEFCNSS